MGSVIYRDRERDRFDDSRTSVSSARRGDDRGGYTTVKRYVVKADDDNRSSFGGASRVRPTEQRVEETRIVRREVDVDEPPRRYERRDDPRTSERELVIRRDRVEEEPRRDYGRREDRTEERELIIRRTSERDEPPRERDLAISRYDDRRDDRYELDIRRENYGDRDLQRYNRTTEYFQPAQPQTIVIRNEIVMPRRDDDYDNIRRSDLEEEKSVVKREPSKGRDEEFFYEKKVRERIEEPARHDDGYDDRKSRREISPHDSVSQVGRRDRGYSSDDSMVYVRHKVTEEEGYDGSRSPKHRRHLAEGVIAGIGAAELLRHHQEKEGKETSGGLSRIGRDVGAGALGALAAEGVTRARSAYRERSKSRRRSRSRSDSRSRGGRDRSRSRAGSRAGSRGRNRSRSESGSRAKKLAGLGLGAAAIAAAAVYAQKKKKEQSQSPNGRGRSSSRRRASSVPASEADDARNPAHRNKRMAGAGAAGAVLAALVERQRSKSRGGRDRSRSRVRQALPVIAAGLGSAGIAAFYEKNKAKKETEAAAAASPPRRSSRSRSRSTSRNRGRNQSADPYYDGPRGAAMSDPNLIEYGQGNVYGNNYGADYYGQPPPGDAYYNNHQNAVVPAIAAAGTYGASREARPSRSRSLSSQSSGDGGRRRRRHRRKRGSRSRSAGKEAVEAVGAGAAATEYEQHKQEKRDRKARRRQEQQGVYGQDPYEDPYNPQQHQQYAPTPVNDPYASQSGFYPQTQQFPPPPGAGPPQFQPQPAGTPFAPGTAYDPNDFPPPPGAAPAQYAGGHFASGGNADPYAPRGADNVSAAPTFGNPFQSQNHSVPDGLSTERSMPPVAPPPLINIQRASVSGESNPRKSNPLLPVPDPFGTSISTPQPFYPPRPTSQPPPTHRKSVAFANTDNTSSTTIASSQQSGHHRHVDATRGYEASDDTDSTIDAQRGNRDSTRSMSQPMNSSGGGAGAAAGASLDPRKKRHHSRRKSADPTSFSTNRSAPVEDTGTSTPRGPPVPPATPASPAPSDDTIDLPDRFDRHGRKKPEPGEDPLADRLDNILAGKGATGKLFGNFVDGLFGPDGRRRGAGGK